MNPLKEHTNLFVNGKFNVRDKGEDGEVAKIIGIEIVNDRYNSNYLILRKKDSYVYESATSYCTLIARKIEDMTDEEHDMWMRKRYSGSEGLFESPCSFNYLLSIGCLPKIWEFCFDNETVIESTTI